MFLNNMSGYYFLLLNLASARTRHSKKEAAKAFLPVRTTVILLQLSAHAAITLLHWPHSVPHDGRCRQEARIEQHFSRVKSHAKGQPSLKEGVYGTAKAHLEELHKKPRKQTGRTLKALSEASACQLSKRALAAATALHVALSDNLTTDAAILGGTPVISSDCHMFFLCVCVCLVLGLGVRQPTEGPACW